MFRLLIKFWWLVPLIVAPARAHADEWPVSMGLESGNTTYCYSFQGAVSEDDGKFSLRSVGFGKLWSLPTAGDGSVIGETKAGLLTNTANSGIHKVSVPAGKGPRNFEVENLTWGCRWTAIAD